MTTRTPQLRTAPARALLILATLAALAGCVLAAPSPASAAPSSSSYGWPIKPFFRQHPVRGAFGDPRILGGSRSFHFGVDVSCANGTSVYATVSGRASRHPLHTDAILVHADDGIRTFGYWHLRPTVTDGQRVVAYRTVIGTVMAPWEHVHFAEQRGSSYVNPLRRGALTPYADRTRPSVRGLAVEIGGRVAPGRTASNVVDLVVEAYDATPLPILGPWNDRPLTPALLEWRIVDPTRSTSSTTGWRTAVDFRTTYPASSLWSSTFARWTRQNKRTRDARYRFFLVRGLDTTSLRDGRYAVQVRATDVRGNTTTTSFRLTVANL